MGLHDCKIVVDSELVGAKNLCAGACKTDHHIKNVNYGRDYKGDIVTDIKLIQPGDPCSVCGAPVKLKRGIEVGQVFKLGTKYSESMHAYYKDEAMQEHPMIMGCYGIGVSRTLAAVVEQNHDDNGIIWPMALAPYQAIVTIVNPREEEQVTLGEQIYQTLKSAGVEVLLDDRDERPGVKFKDADLIGIPVRVTVGKKAGEGLVEFKRRSEPDIALLSASEAVETVISMVNEVR